MLAVFDKEAESGMSLVTVLISLGLVGISAAAAMSWLSNQYKSETKLAALDSVGEIERVLVAAVGDSLRNYTRMGCTATAPAGAPVGTQSALQFLNRTRSLTGYGDLRRVLSVNDINFAVASSPEPAFAAAVAARDANCPGLVPSSTSPAAIPPAIAFKTCFKFVPNATAAAAASAKSLLKASLVFITVDSDLIDLRNNNNLSCSQVKDVAGLLRCSANFQEADKCQNRLEAGYPGAGMAHSYRIFWEMGPAGKKNYQSKRGLIYVPN